MTIVHLPSPFLVDRDTFGRALEEKLKALGLCDLAAQCKYAMRAERDVVKGWEVVMQQTRDAELAFEFEGAPYDIPALV